MNTEEADTLAKRIINTFRLTPPLVEWRDVLVKRDHDTAAAVFAELRDEVDGALSIARFVKHYSARRARAVNARDDTAARATCARCGTPLNADTPTLTGCPDCHIPTTTEGKAIALQTYLAHCDEHAREPHLEYFDSRVVHA